MGDEVIRRWGDAEIGSSGKYWHNFMDGRGQDPFGLQTKWVLVNFQRLLK
jgi:hypothetical protein